MTEDNI